MPFIEDMNIEIKNITKSFGKKEVLSGIDISAQSGMCIGIIGKNGSGKSTLFSVLTGIAKKEKGDFLCDGESLFENSEKRRELVGFVPQTPPLMEELNSLDNLKLWYKKDDLKKELERGVLKMLGIDGFLKTTVNKLSGGMKKRLSIGCAIAHKPKILILDEPSASLDIEGKETVSQFLSAFKNQGGIVLLATHDVAEFEICDKLYLLRNGKAESFLYDSKNPTEIFR